MPELPSNLAGLWAEERPSCGPRQWPQASGAGLLELDWPARPGATGRRHTSGDMRPPSSTPAQISPAASRSGFAGHGAAQSHAWYYPRELAHDLLITLLVKGPQ